MVFLEDTILSSVVGFDFRDFKEGVEAVQRRVSVFCAASCQVISVH